MKPSILNPMQNKYMLAITALATVLLLLTQMTCNAGATWKGGGPDTTSYFVPSAGNNVITACSGIIYDSGGPNGDYPLNADGSLTIYPESPSAKIVLEFLNYEVDYYNYDVVYFYDGPDTLSPLLGSFSKNPGIVYATNPEGVLTVRFKSDDVLTGPGFSAAIRCSKYVPKVDLVVDDMTVSDNYAGYGTSLDIGITVKNTGGNIAGPTTTGVFLSKDLHYDTSDVLLAEVPTASIIAGGSELIYAYVIIPPNTVPGKYHLIAVVDLYNQVNERVEKNNFERKNLYVQRPRYDLFISADSLPDNTLSPDQYVFISWKIDIRGTDDVLAHSGVYLSSDRTIDSSDILLTYFNGLEMREGNPPGELGQTISVPDTIAFGTYYLIYYIESDTGVPETNENNNIAIVPVYIGSPMPDLVPRMEADVLGTADSVLSVIFEVANVGSAPASYSYIGFYLSEDATLSNDDLFLEDDFILPLPPQVSTGGYSHILLPQQLQDGLYYLIAVSDVFDNVAESNESNNNISIPFRVGPMEIDLTITAQLDAPDTVIAGSSYREAFTVTNYGGTSVNTDVSIFISRDTIIDDQDVYYITYPLLVSANANYSISDYLPIPADLSPGNYYVLYYVDRNNIFAETNEGNNQAAIGITVAEDTATILPAASASFTREGQVENILNINSYPNPTTGKFTLSFNTNIEDEDAVITVYNSSGEIVRQKSMTLSNGSLTDFDLSGYAKGMYAVKTVAGEKIYIHKVLVE